MLGFNSSREPVRGTVAKKIREQLFEMATSAQSQGANTASCSSRSSKYQLVKA